jgi:hypothetical protein
MPTLSPRAKLARRRALLAMSGVVAMLLLLWFADALSGLVPAKPYPATTHQVGAYRVTLTLSPTTPTTSTMLHAQASIINAAGHTLDHATVTYRWAMVEMDMGTFTGSATADKTPGRYDATIQGLMGGTWRLTLTIHQPNTPDSSTSFDIPVRG